MNLRSCLDLSFPETQGVIRHSHMILLVFTAVSIALGLQSLYSNSLLGSPVTQVVEHQAPPKLISSSQDLTKMKNGQVRCLSNDPNQTGFDLVMSAFITNDRPRGNRYPRLDVFNATIHSYKDLPIDRIYLYVEFDEEFKWFEPHLRSLANNIWGSKLRTLEYRRMTCQEDLAPIVYSLCDGGDRLGTPRAPWVTTVGVARRSRTARSSWTTTSSAFPARPTTRRR